METDEMEASPEGTRRWRADLGFVRLNRHDGRLVQLPHVGDLVVLGPSARS